MNITGEFLGCLMMLTAAFITDIRTMKIPNFITVTGIITGVGWHLVNGGWNGGLNAFTGAAAGFGMLLVLYLFGAVGGGDVKLFGAIGAWTGTMLTLHILMYSIFVAGMIGIVILLWRREIFSRMRGMVQSVLGAYLLKSWGPIRAGTKQQLQIPFMLAILPGAILGYYYHLP